MSKTQMDQLLAMVNELGDEGEEVDVEIMKTRVMAAMEMSEEIVELMVDDSQVFGKMSHEIFVAMMATFGKMIEPIVNAACEEDSGIEPIHAMMLTFSSMAQVTEAVFGGLAVKFLPDEAPNGTEPIPFTMQDKMLIVQLLARHVQSGSEDDDATQE